MSTRSGKRIHNSFHENTIKADPVLVAQSEKKTRSKCLKENNGELGITIIKSKKRQNYVKYPSDEEINTEVDGKTTRNLRKKALKEHNTDIESAETNSFDNTKKLIRTKRKSKKPSKNNSEDVQESNNNENEAIAIVEKPKTKKKKKVVEVLNQEFEVPKKKSKKKKGRRSSSLIIEDIVEHHHNRDFNQTNVSNVSFHSAAGSPIIVSETETICETLNGIAEKDTTFDKVSLKELKSQESCVLNLTFEGPENISESMILQKNERIIKPKKKSNLIGVFGKLKDLSASSLRNDSSSKDNNTTFDENDPCKKKQVSQIDKGDDVSTSTTKGKKRKLLNTTFDNNIEVEEITNTVTSERGSAKKSKSVRNTTFDMVSVQDNDLTLKKELEGKIFKRKSIMNSTYEKVNNTLLQEAEIIEISNKRKSVIKDTTFEKENTSTFSENNLTSEKSSTKDNKRKSFRDSTIDKLDLSQIANKEATFDDINTSQRKSVIVDTTFEKSNSSIISVNNCTFENESNANEQVETRKSVQSTTFEKSNSSIISVNNCTFENESNANEQVETRKSVQSTTFAKIVNINDDIKGRKSALKDSTFDKDDLSLTENKQEKFESSRKIKEKGNKSIMMDTGFKKGSNQIFDKDSNINESVGNGSSIKYSTLDKKTATMNSNDNTLDMESDTNTSNKKRESTLQRNSIKIDIVKDTDLHIQPENKRKSVTTLNTLNETFDKQSKSSLISSDDSVTTNAVDGNVTSESNVTLDNISSISLTSDESHNIINTTPVIVESSIDETLNQTVQTPLKREGTFTKDCPEVTVPKSPKLPSISPKTTPKKQVSLPSPGCTPFHFNVIKKKSIMNVTRSIEKDRRSSLHDSAPRVTKVMFCSPVNDPVVVDQHKRKIIKSNLKGSNKSFVFEHSAKSPRPAPRKRSYTHNDAEDSQVKRKCLADGLQLSVDRLSRPRTSSASAKLAEPTTPSRKTPQKEKHESKLPRTKLPNFAALHQKQFDKMESLDECQERKAKRAKQLLTPTGAVSVLERSSPRGPIPEQQKQKEPNKDNKAGPNKSLPTLASLKPGFSRFGFKLHVENNPFIAPNKTTVLKNNPFATTNKTEIKKKTPFKIQPSSAGSTTVRKQAAKQVVMREKSFTDRRKSNRCENRTIIKGVRTNRRFELQMRLRNID